jgi:hypothetical protein
MLVRAQTQTNLERGVWSAKIGKNKKKGIRRTMRLEKNIEGYSIVLESQ